MKSQSVMTFVLTCTGLLAACGEGGRLSAASAAAPTFSARAGEDVARGVVFADANANGQRDGDEAGIPGVRVSNGVDVVLSDAAGEYAITLPPESILFISKPADYRVPVDEHHSAQFFYRHYPQGSPAVAQWSYPVIEPTGPLPASIDFPLIPAPEENLPHFAAHVFADPQAGNEVSEDMFREDVINELIGNPHGALFGVTVGDIVNDNLALYERHIPIMGLIGIPQWYLPGNHDINFESPDDKHSLETYKRYFGPPNYSFDYGQVHFIALDNVAYDGTSGYIGQLSEDQLRWIRNDLASVPRESLIVIATHIPLITYAEGGDNINTVNLDALISIFNDYGFERVYGMAGHDTSNSWKVTVDHSHGFHGYKFIAHTLAEVRGAGWNGPDDERGVRDASMADGNPNGYYLMRFSDDYVQPRFIPASSNPGQNLRFIIDPPLEVNPAGVQQLNDLSSGRFGSNAINRGRMQPGTKLVINIFDGGDQHQVELSLDGGPWQTLPHVLRTDPYYERLFQKYVGTDDQPATAVVSSHIWEFGLPTDLKPGLHHVKLRSLDEFGQVISGGYAFELVP